MSNLLYMDESNGNGVYAAKAIANLSTAAAAAPSATTTTALAISLTQQQQHSNLNTTNATTTTGSPSNNNIMNSAARSAAVAAAATVVDNLVLPTSVSNEDLSQSLSEYTDADESISAPTEFLAEFLSAVMLKDYKKALKYCKLILQYEPNNSTAKEFYPLILDKLRGHTSDDSDENYNKSSSPDLVLEVQSSDPSGGDGYMDGSDDPHMPDEPYEEPGIISSSSCSAGLSMSDSVDDDDDDVDDDNVDDEDDDEEDDVMSSSGDDLPIDDAPEECGGDSLEVSGGADVNAGNTGSSRNSSSGGGGRSRSDNTTHSYSSLLLEEEDDIVPVCLQFAKAPELPSPDLDVSNGNKMPSASCSDSESPTEPLTQRLAAILRSKCGVSNSVPGPGDK